MTARLSLATLRKLEWAGDEDGWSRCAICEHIRDIHAKHAPDCELDAAIREAEQAEKSEPMPDLQVGDEVSMAQIVTFRREDAAAGWRPARPLSVKRNGVVIWRKEAPTP